MSLKPICAVACLIACPASTVAAEATRLFETLRPSIVLISSAEGIGSGIVIAADGLILTNLHVANTPLALSVTVTVEQTGKRVERTFEGLHLHKVHQRSDLALLKIDAPECRFIPARLAKGEADCKTGEACFALGFPFLPGQTRSDLTLTQGIINSTHREIEGKSYLQIDAAISPGNSGGALVNANGIVVGIPTLRYEGANRVGLAIPVASIRMQDFSAAKDRQTNPAAADLLDKQASAYLAKDVFGGGDAAAALMALQLFREALSEDPGNANRWHLVSETFRHLGMLRPARAYAEHAACLDPANFVLRFALATICDELHDGDGALDKYLACLPLLGAVTNELQKTGVCRKAITLASGRREALRTLYLISWSKAILGGTLSFDDQLQVKRLSGVLPADLVEAMLAKNDGHSIVEMQLLAAAHPQLIPEAPTRELPPADASKVKEEAVASTAIRSKVSFPQGDTARLADAPDGVVYKPAEGVVEWTPVLFSADTEIRVLFLVTHPDGKEDTVIHTIKREP
jgi:hypothetical protein